MKKTYIFYLVSITKEQSLYYFYVCVLQLALARWLTQFHDKAGHVMSTAAAYSDEPLHNSFL